VTTRVVGLRLLATVLIALLIAGCMPAAASREGQAIDDLYRVFLAGGVVVAVIVWGLATWVLLRYRRRGREELPVQTRGNNPIEAIWTITPLITVLGLFVLTVGTLNTVSASDPTPVRIQVTAFRWGWQAVYPDSGRTVAAANGQPADLVMPVDQPIEIQLSAVDVNHAFFVPAFLFKKDAIPGRPTTFQIRIAHPGSYPGACAEYCGIGHDSMPFVITAVAAGDFQTWLGGGALPSQPPAPPAGSVP
jgi:cytochrome c oxidase subunit 2